MKWMFAVVTCFCFFQSRAQYDLPTEYFDDPLQIPLALAGTFGELRSNHFHSGLDIKTQFRQGIPVYASAEGKVSRIKVSHYGYGKALYIEHPNGFTTVYAHLKNFSPEIEAYVKQRQYEQESYEIELFPGAETLQVERGELVAHSGNTGGSGGPHLHFEIRDHRQRPMNPLMFGIEIKDTRAPLVRALYAYPVGEGAHVNGSTQRQELELIPQADGSYRTQPIKACGKIGFGVATVDQLDAAPNKNGVFRITAEADGEKRFQANFEKFSFAETRHLNQLIDYGFYTQNGRRIQKLFVEPSNPLSIYSDLVNRGFLDVRDSTSHTYRVSIKDFAGNERQITIPIQGEMAPMIEGENDPTTPYFAAADQHTHFADNGIEVSIPAGSLYQDTHLDVSFGDDQIKLHEDVIPLHKNISITFDISQYPKKARENLFVAQLNEFGHPDYSSTYRTENSISTKTRTFGTYSITSDSNPPRVRAENFRDGQWISNHEELRVKISDDLSGIKKYRATVNGKFILMEYEYKQDLLTHKFSDGVVTETENHLKIEVVDNVGNTTIFEHTFFRKPS